MGSEMVRFLFILPMRITFCFSSSRCRLDIALLRPLLLLLLLIPLGGLGSSNSASSISSSPYSAAGSEVGRVAGGGAETGGEGGRGVLSGEDGSNCSLFSDEDDRCVALDCTDVIFSLAARAEQLQSGALFKCKDADTNDRIYSISLLEMGLVWPTWLMTLLPECHINVIL